MCLLYLCESEFGPAKDLWRPGAAQDYLWPSLQSHNETKCIRYTFVNLPPVSLVSACWAVIAALTTTAVHNTLHLDAFCQKANNYIMRP